MQTKYEIQRNEFAETLATDAASISGAPKLRLLNMAQAIRNDTYLTPPKSRGNVTDIRTKRGL